MIENRGGAGGMIGTEAAAKATPDGYTFLLTPGATLTILPHLRQAPYDAVKGFEPVGRVGDLVSGFVIHPAVGVKTFKELIEYAKKNPGKLAYGSAGLGTATQLRIEMLKYRAGIDILHVPYRGSADALNDLLPNNIQMMNEINVLPHVKAGKLILLNVNFSRAPPRFPGRADADRARLSRIPTCRSGSSSARLPARPKEIIGKLNAKMVEIAKSDDMIAKMRAINVVVPPQTPEEIRAYMADGQQAQRRPDQGRQHQARIGLLALLPSPHCEQEWGEGQLPISPVDVGHQEGAVGDRCAGRRDREARLLGGEHHVLVHDRVAAAADQAHLSDVAGLRQEQLDGDLAERVAGGHRSPESPYDATPELVVLARARDVGRPRERRRAAHGGERRVGQAQLQRVAGLLQRCAPGGRRFAGLLLGWLR